MCAIKLMFVPSKCHLFQMKEVYGMSFISNEGGIRNVEMSFISNEGGIQNVIYFK